MTIPALFSAENVYTMVPLGLKRDILTKLFLAHEPTSALPASILRNVDGKLFVGKDSCPSGSMSSELFAQT